MRRDTGGLLALTMASAACAADAVPLVGPRRKRGDAAAVRALVRRQPATVNVAAADGMTALHYAVRANDARWCRRCCAPRPT